MRRLYLISALLAAGLVSVLSIMQYMVLSHRLSSVESTIQDGKTMITDGKKNRSTSYSDVLLAPHSVPISNRGHELISPSADRENLINRLQDVKRRQSLVNPGSAALTMDKLMAQEPSIPSIEQSQAHILQQAISNIPPKTSPPTGLKTSCRGRRCAITAAFQDEYRATEWVNALVLAGGQGFPKSARYIPIPPDGNGGNVELKIYLY